MTKFKVRDPDYEARVRESFGRQPFMAMIGAALRSVEPGRVAIEVPCEDHIAQQHGFFMGVSSERLQTMQPAMPRIP